MIAEIKNMMNSGCRCFYLPYNSRLMKPVVKFINFKAKATPCYILGEDKRVEKLLKIELFENNKEIKISKGSVVLDNLRLGIPCSDIVKNVGVSRQYVYQLASKHKIKIQRQKQRGK